MCLGGEKSVVQKFVLEFRSHSLGSILCKRKKCSAKVCVGIRNTIPKEVFCEKKSFSLLSLLHRSNLGKWVQDFYANLENILKIR